MLNMFVDVLGLVAIPKAFGNFFSNMIGENENIVKVVMFCSSGSSSDFSAKTS